jgi:inosine-uridine nucleoside N-ribohydrolase
MRKIILDMDPGIDDAVTLLMALNNPDLDILAITAANGNVDVHTSALNALRIIEAAGRKVIVGMGTDRPLCKNVVHATRVHGRSGLGNSNLPKPERTYPDAVKLVENIINAHKRRSITVICTAPLTNMAILLQRDPSIVNKFERIVLMGGMYGVAGNVMGNVTPYAEFNFYCDPEAANLLLNSGARILAVGLDVTTNFRCAVTKSMLKRIGMLGGRIAEVASSILEYPVFKYGLFHLHDVFALAALLDPKMFSTVNCSVNVINTGKFRGQCTIVGKGNVDICSHVDHRRFMKFVLAGLKQRGS